MDVAILHALTPTTLVGIIKDLHEVDEPSDEQMALGTAAWNTLVILIGDEKAWKLLMSSVVN